ncbi:hypothetical protein KN10_2795 [Anoxybacillus flavithermus NBRC 109594]|uniref:Uncharacterized protein n=1 Tax=Anoxybacillus flavithermus NBRC 109594 TaxID=1315967 RepID=R4G299_9BACL|nr:hypothetical protein [Anoxybacillus flavithermus]GAC92359.1 hypothetical protein KN10_2795 [Anoxybacillus flavithermus NBRC 109594]
MALFKRKEKDEFFPETNDILIVFDDEKKTSDIQRISDIRDNAIYVTGKYHIPLDDCEVTTGPEGRHFFYRAPSRSVQETKRLAELEKSIVLRQITAYRAPEPQSQMDITKILLFGLVFFAFIVMGISSCSGGGS